MTATCSACVNSKLAERDARRIQRLLTDSKLPREKTLEAFDRNRIKKTVDRQFAVLLKGFSIAVKTSGVWKSWKRKTHLLCALGHELVRKGRSVYFVPCALLVQRLLLAKAELWLEKELKRLDKFDALIIDDLGYVQQSREEMEVLFTLLAHRYEHRSVLLTSNLVFSQMGKDL